MERRNYQETKALRKNIYTNIQDTHTHTPTKKLIKL